ncbi:DUF3631 domain-containing protein [Desulfobulbus rhabdoformis]|uniref:DUF3631 domain-containing protein n=1 Tax=Desulfobulbus rhabdoformis TaxID=34032 RepID=UPI0019654153|nr:DUF3631 domain-containing protein [Desulfobulbus rhabdoformis]MBM9615985.1 DUF3631 domain-containing protein [Desulfobulbus rhabdoformis]
MREYVDRIGEALGGKQKTGGGWICHCPAHDDKNPSLSVDPGDNGKVVVKCWAGCSQLDVISALRIRGLWPENPTSGNAAKEAGPRNRAKERNRQNSPDQDEMMARAAKRWAAATPASKEHPYLVRKGLNAPELRQEGNLLLVPMCNKAGAVCSLQTINPNGQKLFLKGIPVTGLCCSIGTSNDTAKTVCLAEGWATGSAIHAATGYPVAVAFSTSNLRHVAKIIRARHPGSTIIVCADDDRKADSKKNPGIEAATTAAKAVGGLLAVPDMGKKADFWDLWHKHGANAVQDALECAQPVSDQQDATASKPEEDDPEAMVRYLASLSAIEYEQKRRAVAEALGVRASALDRAVKEAGQGKEENSLPFNEPDPWPDPVEPGELLTDIATTIQRFIVCTDEIAQAVALWSAMTWFIDVVQIAPLAVITAPEKRCGKSQLLFLLGRLSARALTASSISPAALYRAIDAWQPTLLIDEADAFMKDNEELRGIINSGHTRESAYVIRTVGDNFTPAKFNTWGAKALAGIGHIADTIMDRAVILELRRKLPHEEVDRLRYAEPDLFNNLRSKLARFAEDYSEEVRLARPPLPHCLNDRAQDNWEPLLAIALVAGGQWPVISTRAAIKLSGNESPTQTIGVELLADIKQVFEAKEVDRISTADLIRALCEDEEKPWLTYNRGKSISPRQMANKLKGYGITSTTLRFRHVGTAKGYERRRFDEAFSRYIPAAYGVLSVTA